MRATEFINESQQTTLNQLYDGDFPDEYDRFWDEVRPDEFDLPLTIHTMPKNNLMMTLLSQYQAEHVDDLVDMLDDEQDETVRTYMNDPTLSSKVIVMSGHQIIDGNHRALAAALKGVPINYVDLAELEDEDYAAESGVSAGGASHKWMGKEFYRHLV